MWNLRTLRHALSTGAKRSVVYSERHFRILGFLAVVVVPLSAFVEQAITHPTFDTFPLRLIAGLALSLLLFYPRLPSWILERFHIYWVLGLAYLFPFTFALMLILNAISTPTDTNASLIWVFEYIVAIFLFIQLINHAALSLILWFLGFVLAIPAVFFIDTPNWTALLNTAVYPMPVFVAAIAIGIITNRNVSIVQVEQLKAVSAVGSNLAHELRTPLAAIRSLARGLTNYMPNLVDSYEKAERANLDIQPIRPKQLQRIREVLESIENEVNFSNTIIDMLLVNTADRRSIEIGTEAVSTTECITEAVKRFPFNNNSERGLLSTSIENEFYVGAPKLLVVHVLFNLIKNGLYYVQRKGKGAISISTSVSEDANYIIVHDTGSGIPLVNQRQIFDRFYTTSDSGQGAGIGLSFCKIVMESIDGQIMCESVEGEYTTFKLRFPKL